MKLEEFNKLISSIHALTEVEKEYLKNILNNNTLTPIKNKDIVNVEEESTSYEDTPTIVKGFTNTPNASIGEEIVIPHSRYGDIPFIVIGKDHDADNSVTLLTRDILRLLAFDAMESYSNNRYRRAFGNNRYKYSNILQWMNSDKVAGKWYTARHSVDAAPSDTNVVSYNPYSDVDGFLRGFDPGVIAQMITVDKTTALHIVDGGGSEVISSKVFLLSTTEVGLDNEDDIAEGKIYEYFSNNNVDVQRLAYPSTYCLNNAGGYTSTNFVSGKPWYWWLRTPHSGNSGNVRSVNTSGALHYNYAYHGYCGLRFAICLPTDKYLELKEKED